MGKEKAAIACLLFIGFGVFGWFRAVETFSLPLLLYYVILVVNTFFSIRTFAPITPRNTVQTLFDIVLAILYLALALSFASVFFFSLISAALFLGAVGKYTHLLRLVAYPTLLRRKIRLNALAALLSAVVFCTAVAGFPEIAAWLLCIVFGLANIYVLVIRPMYRIS